MNCKNCNNHIQGKYCSNCGQKANTTRLDLGQLFNQLLHSLLQLEHGLLYTIKELSIRPGHAIRNYLNGERKKHFKPLSYTLLISTAYVLTTTLTNSKTYLGDLLSNTMESAKSQSGTGETDLLTQTLLWLSENFVYSSLILLPIFSLASYLAFKKYRYYYAEHLVLNIYITGHQTLIYMISDGVFKMINVNEDIVMGINLLSVIVFHFWSYIQFFNTSKPIYTSILVLVAYALNIVFTPLTLRLVLFLYETIF